MHRIYVRVPDAMMAALRRELDKERKYRGTRYSMNDLCVLKLGGIGVHMERNGDVSGTLVIPRVPPPPPVPIQHFPTSVMPWQREREEPQPERQVQAAPVIEDNTVSKWVEETREEYVPDEHAEELTDIAIARMESEGGPDGHMDD